MIRLRVPFTVLLVIATVSCTHTVDGVTCTSDAITWVTPASDTRADQTVPVKLCVPAGASDVAIVITQPILHTETRLAVSPPYDLQVTIDGLPESITYTMVASGTVGGNTLRSEPRKFTVDRTAPSIVRTYTAPESDGRNVPGHDLVVVFSEPMDLSHLAMEIPLVQHLDHVEDTHVAYTATQTVNVAGQGIVTLTPSSPTTGPEHVVRGVREHR